MFRFTIRDVLWLTVVVAFGVGWWMDHASLVIKHEQALSAVGNVVHQLMQERDNGVNERNWLKQQLDR